jgi:divalent metal cation (Fe/Co/Zn/Cd) transporter
MTSPDTVENKTHLVSKVLWLAWFTIIYNLIEGIISIRFGYQDDSISLLGFGVDSLIEVGSAFVVLWRFRGDVGKSGSSSIQKEKRATLIVGLLFLLLGIGTAASSLVQLRAQSHPATTVPGLIISILSLSFMFFLWKKKRNLGLRLASQTVLKDANCSLACIKLSSVLFIGSGFFLFFPKFWWLDSTAALILAALIIREGWETIQVVRSDEFSGGCGCNY